MMENEGFEADEVFSSPRYVACGLGAPGIGGYCIGH